LGQCLAVAFEAAKFTMLNRYRAIRLLRNSTGTDFVLVDVKTNDRLWIGVISMRLSLINSTIIQIVLSPKGAAIQRPITL
jgi:hypothetical protein